MRRLHRGRVYVFAIAAAIMMSWFPASAASGASPASCREAANGLISLLDSGDDNSPLYRNTYNVVVDSCGPAAPNSPKGAPSSPSSRAACHALAAAMVDLIEDDKMDSPTFADARDAFAQTCAPR